MTLLEQAARQALEALEDYRYRGAPFACIPAINALQQALEQKQEPVAWMYSDAQGRTTLVKSNVAPYEDATPLYAEPPKREWVGLTEEEAADCWSTSAVKSWKNIEAKLKEKNT